MSRRTSTTPSRRAIRESRLSIASWRTATSTSSTTATTATRHVDATFRVTGKAPELWHAETGKSEPASYTIANGRTTVPLHLEPWGTVFVVFRKPATAPTRTLPKVVETKLADVDGPWSVSFQPDRGAPASITLDKLISWTESADAGVKYFSGDWHLHEDASGVGGLVQAGRERLARPGRREEPGRGDGERKLAGRRVARALSRGRDQGAEAREERDRQSR